MNPKIQKIEESMSVSIYAHMRDRRLTNFRLFISDRMHPVWRNRVLKPSSVISTEPLRNTIKKK